MEIPLIAQHHTPSIQSTSSTPVAQYCALTRTYSSPVPDLDRFTMAAPPAASLRRAGRLPRFPTDHQQAREKKQVASRRPAAASLKSHRRGRSHGGMERCSAGRQRPPSNPAGAATAVAAWRDAALASLESRWPAGRHDSTFFSRPPFFCNSGYLGIPDPEFSGNIFLESFSGVIS